MSETLAFNESPETFEQRKLAVSRTLAELAKWPHCNHGEDQFNDEVRSPKVGGVYSFTQELKREIDRGRAPSFVWYDNHESLDTYAWQIFATTAAGAMLMDKGEVQDELDDARHRFENEVGKPTAQDGSKGQWRAEHQAEINTYRWLLEGGDE